MSKRKRKRQQILKRRIILGGLTLFVGAVIVSTAFQYVKNEQKVEAVSRKTKIITTKAIEAAKEEKKKVDKNEVEETPQEQLKRVKKEAVAKGYPAEVTALLDKNPETVDFVEKYGENKDKAAAADMGDDLTAGKIPNIYQWDIRWGYAPYGSSIVAVSGCGPTCLSMVVAGLTNDATVTPDKVAAYGMQHDSVDTEDDTYWAFMEEASANWNITCYEGTLDENAIRSELEAGHPIICSVGPGDFTKNGHFIVLVGYDNGNIKVHDPFSRTNSEKDWTYAQLEGQIMAMWVYSL